MGIEGGELSDERCVVQEYLKVGFSVGVHGV